MVSKQDDEDYWNDSETKAKARAFNFEEEEYGNQLCGVSMSGTARLSQQVRADMRYDTSYLNTDSLSGTLATVTFGDSGKFETPLNTIIPDKSLACILNATKPTLKEIKSTVPPDEELRILRRRLEDIRKAPPVEETVTKILLGHPYSLEYYKSLQNKIDLLDMAIKLGDGNAILAIVLFIVKTLKKGLVYKIFSTRPEAVNHYIQYLDTRMQLHELTDLLTMLGRTREAAIKHFRVAARSKLDVNRQLVRLRSCATNHFSGPDNKDGEHVKQFIKLLEWQTAMATNDGDLAQGLIGLPVLGSIAHACKHHWGEPKGSFGSPLTLCQQQGVNERQYRWTALAVRSALQSWEDISSILASKKSWLGGTKLNTVPMDELVRLLHANGAPTTLLMKYVQLIDDKEKQIGLIHKLQCHRVAIDLYILQRDRRALINYKANLSPQSEDYVYAENVLQDSSIKWRN